MRFNVFIFVALVKRGVVTLVGVIIINAERSLFTKCSCLNCGGLYTYSPYVYLCVFRRKNKQTRKRKEKKKEKEKIARAKSPL